jgi:glycosyltransferase involved in cell wall biosynthesis
LPTTLSHLKVQELARVPWELLIIDNVSTDGTAEVARSCWQNAPAPFRVVRESRLGVRYARERGLSEARHTFLGFVDDPPMAADHEPALIKTDSIVDRVLSREGYRTGFRLNRGRCVGTYKEIGHVNSLGKLCTGRYAWTV